MCWCPKLEGLIDSICFINSILSTSSGRDRLDVLYQLDFIGRDRLDVFYQLDLSTSSGKDRLDVFYRSGGRISLDSKPLGRRKQVSRAAMNRGYLRLVLKVVAIKAQRRLAYSRSE